jgi:hypothetical protein
VLRQFGESVEIKWLVGLLVGHHPLEGNWNCSRCVTDGACAQCTWGGVAFSY